VHLHAGAEAVCDVLFALGDGLAIRMLAEPDRDWAPTVDAAELAVRALLDAKQREGVVHLHAGAEEVCDVLFALGDGLAIRMLAEPDRDWAPTVDAAELAVRALLA